MPYHLIHRYGFILPHSQGQHKQLKVQSFCQIRTLLIPIRTQPTGSVGLIRSSRSDDIASRQRHKDVLQGWVGGLDLDREAQTTQGQLQ